MTLASKTSKRSIDEVEYDASEYDGPGVLNGSPGKHIYAYTPLHTLIGNIGSKRARVEV